MKKLSTLLLLLMLFMGGVISSAQTFTASDAPSNGQWSENTHWYTIKFKNQAADQDFRYWSLRSNLLTEDGSMTTDVQGNNDLVAEDLWCAVCVDEANKGYQFYNYTAGTTKILGMTGSEDGGRAKMYEKSALADNSDVYTTFYYNQTAFRYDGVVPNAFRVATTGNNYLNSRTQNSKAYLAFWNNSEAIKNCSGSAFLFTGLDELASTIQS